VLGRDWLNDAATQGIITPREAEQVRDADRYIAKVVAVDHFEQSEITGKPTVGHNSRTRQPSARPNKQTRERYAHDRTDP